MALLSNPKLDAVSKNSIWEEHVKKENRTIKLGETFNITDPRKMNILPEKPNRTVPTQNPSKAMVAEAASTLRNLACLKDTDKGPIERYAMPVTANMEYGFFSKTPLVPTNPMFDYRSKMSDVTDYANTYASLAGKSPYARNDMAVAK